VQRRGGHSGAQRRYTFLYDPRMSNLAIAHTLREAHRALAAGTNVFLSDDPPTLADELTLKTEADARGLLVLSGTAIIEGTPLGIANAVRRGSIGIIGTSGSGIQEVSSLIHQLGAGVSHALGTGSRDLSEEVGGSSTLRAIDLLGRDEATSLIVLIATAPAAAARVLDAAAATGKPIVACLLGVDPTTLPAPPNAKLISTLEGAALSAATQTIRSFRKTPGTRRPALDATVASSRYCIRGLYSGGALAYEALSLLAEATPQIASNVKFRGAASLAHSAETHTTVDLGAEPFREGRLHPIVDPAVRIARIREVAGDPRSAILLLDVILGFGAHADPASALLDAIGAVRSRGIVVIASVTGTDEDPQNRDAQVQKLAAAGVIVARSNAAAARYAMGAVGLVGMSAAMLDDMTPLTDEAPAAAGAPLFGSPLEIRAGSDVEPEQVS
jgi:FdrA protein